MIMEESGFPVKEAEEVLPLGLAFFKKREDFKIHCNEVVTRVQIPAVAYLIFTAHRQAGAFPLRAFVCA